MKKTKIGELEQIGKLEQDSEQQEYHVYHNHDVSYKPVNLNMRTLTYRNFFWKAESLLIVSLLNVVITFIDLIYAAFIPDGIHAIEAIGLLAPIQMIFIHMSFMSMMNMGVFLHKDWTKYNLKQFHDNLVTALISTIIYGLTLSMVYLGFGYAYVHFFFGYNAEVQSLAQTFIFYTFITIFFYVILTTSLKTLIFINKKHQIRYFITLAIVLNLILPLVFAFEMNIGGSQNLIFGDVAGLGLGTLIAFAIPSLLSLFYVLFSLHIFKHNIEYNFKVVLKLLYGTWRPTSLYTSITICKAIAYIAIALTSVGHPQKDSIMIAQVLVFNLINFVALVQRSTGLSIGYRMAGKTVYYDYFQKYKSNLHKFFIKNSIVFMIWGTMVLAFYPLFIDLFSMNNVDLFDNIGNMSWYQLKLDLIWPFVMMFIFHFGVLSSTCYSTFISSMVGKNTTFVHIMWLLLLMVIMMFTFGFDYVSWPSILSLVVPMGLYGLTMWMMVGSVYWWYILRPKGKAKLIEKQRLHNIDKEELLAKQALSEKK